MSRREPYWPGSEPGEFPEIQELPRKVLFGPVQPRSLTIPLSTLVVVAGAVGVVWAGGIGPFLGVGIVLGVLALWGLLLVGFLQGATALALWLARRGRVRQGLDLLNQLAVFYGTTAPFVMPRANLLLGCHFPEEAVEYLEAKKHELTPRLMPHAKACMGTALVLLERDLDRAEALLGDVRAARPEWREVRLTLGMALYLQQRYAEALEEFEAAADLVEREPHTRRGAIYFAMGDCCAALGRRKEAAPFYVKSRELAQPPSPAE